MNTSADIAVRKPRLVILGGYLYLSNPIYFALQKQLKRFEVIYYFPKDIIGSDINHDSDEYRDMVFDDEKCIQLQYSPKWFHAAYVNWSQNFFFTKIKDLYNVLLDLSKYRKLIIHDLENLKPDVVLCLSDIFFVSRLVAAALPKTPLFILQPSFIDFSKKKFKYKKTKIFVNFFFKNLFNQQQYFGLEIIDSKLLLTENATYNHYARLRENVYRVNNPALMALRDDVLSCKLEAKRELLHGFGLDFHKKTLIIFASHFETIYGKNFQLKFEKLCLDLIDKINNFYNIIIKIHPNSTSRYWEKLFELHMTRGVILVRDIEKKSLLVMGDVSIATNSYASVEAAIAGLITINYYPGENFIGKENFASIDSYYTFKAYSDLDVFHTLNALQDKKYFEVCSESFKAEKIKVYFDSDQSRDIEELLLEACSKA